MALPAGQDANPALDEMRQIVNKYAANGVPDDLVDAAKRAEIAQAEFQRNSIPGPGVGVVEALAGEGRNSPDEDIEAMKKVTLADVNRVAKQYLLNAATITATLKPAPNGEPVAQKGFGGARSDVRADQTGELPRMGEKELKPLKVPTSFIPVSDTTLAERHSADRATRTRPVPQ